MGTACITIQLNTNAALCFKEDSADFGTNYGGDAGKVANAQLGSFQLSEIYATCDTMAPTATEERYSETCAPWRATVSSIPSSSFVLPSGCAGAPAERACASCTKLCLRTSGPRASPPACNRGSGVSPDTGTDATRRYTVPVDVAHRTLGPPGPPWRGVGSQGLPLEARL